MTRKRLAPPLSKFCAGGYPSSSHSPVTLRSSHASPLFAARLCENSYGNARGEQLAAIAVVFYARITVSTTRASPSGVQHGIARVNTILFSG